MDNVEDEVAEREREVEQDRETARGHDLLRRIDFGLQVEAFMRSEVYQRLHHDSETERAELVGLVVALDPDDSEQRRMIQAHRRRIGILEHWQDVFDKYINDGRVAEAEFQERDG